MSGALGIAAMFVGIACLVYMAKGSHGTKWDGTIAPGHVLGQLLLGNWPYGSAGSVVQTSPAGPTGAGGPVGPTGPTSGTPSSSGGAIA